MVTSSLKVKCREITSWLLKIARQKILPRATHENYGQLHHWGPDHPQIAFDGPGVSRNMMLVLTSLAVPLVCVCACSCVGVSFSYVEILNFEGEAMVEMSTFISGSVQVLLCNEALRQLSRRSCANQYLVSLADVPQSCKQNMLYLCCVQSILTH